MTSEGQHGGDQPAAATSGAGEARPTGAGRTYGAATGPQTSEGFSVEYAGAPRPPITARATASVPGIRSTPGMPWPPTAQDAAPSPGSPSGDPFQHPAPPSGPTPPPPAAPAGEQAPPAGVRPAGSPPAVSAGAEDPTPAPSAAPSAPGSVPPSTAADWARAAYPSDYGPPPYPLAGSGSPFVVPAVPVLVPSRDSAEDAAPGPAAPSAEEQARRSTVPPEAWPPPFGPDSDGGLRGPAEPGPASTPAPGSPIPEREAAARIEGWDGLRSGSGELPRRTDGPPHGSALRPDGRPPFGGHPPSPGLAGPAADGPAPALPAPAVPAPALPAFPPSTSFLPGATEASPEPGSAAFATGPAGADLRTTHPAATPPPPLSGPVPGQPDGPPAAGMSVFGGQKVRVPGATLVDLPDAPPPLAGPGRRGGDLGSGPDVAFGEAAAVPQPRASLESSAPTAGPGPDNVQDQAPGNPRSTAPADGGAAPPSHPVAGPSRTPAGHPAPGNSPLSGGDPVSGSGPTPGGGSAAGSAAVPAASRATPPADPAQVPPPAAGGRSRVYGRPIPADRDQPPPTPPLYPPVGPSAPAPAGRATASARVTPPPVGTAFPDQRAGGFPEAGSVAGPFGEAPPDRASRPYGEQTSNIAGRISTPPAAGPEYPPVPAPTRSPFAGEPSAASSPPFQGPGGPYPGAGTPVERAQRDDLPGAAAFPASPPPAAFPTSPPAVFPTQGPTPAAHPPGPAPTPAPAAAPPTKLPAAEPEATPHVRKLPVMLAVLVAAFLLVAIPMAIVSLFVPDPTLQVEPGGCVRQEGDRAVAAACSEPGAHVVVSKVEHQDQCPDPVQPYVINPTGDGRNQVLCLRSQP